MRFPAVSLVAGPDPAFGLDSSLSWGPAELPSQLPSFLPECVDGQWGHWFFCLFVLSGFFFLMYLFLAALGLHCCPWAFSSCGERGLLFVVVCGLLIAVASLVAEHGL